MPSVLSTSSTLRHFRLTRLRLEVSVDANRRLHSMTYRGFLGAGPRSDDECNGGCYVSNPVGWRGFAWRKSHARTLEAFRIVPLCASSPFESGQWHGCWRLPMPSLD